MKEGQILITPKTLYLISSTDTYLMQTLSSKSHITKVIKSKQRISLLISREYNEDSHEFDGKI